MVLKGIAYPAPDPMTVETFKEWLKQFDKNGDGRISRNELRDGLRLRGGWWFNIRCGRALRQADKNHNGFVDDTEIENLIGFAQKHLGMNVSLR